MGGNTFLADRAESDWKRADPGDGAAINPKSGVQEIIIGSGTETNTLSDPTAIGELLFIWAFSDGGGTRAITAATAINVTGNTVMTFGEVRDNIALISVREGTAGAMKWEVLANNGVALS